MSTRSDRADSILMARFVLRRAARAGLDPDRLAQRAGVPGWSDGGERDRVSSRHCLRLWELLEQESNDPDIALRSATGTDGELGLLEYLFLAAPTLGAALDDCLRLSGSLTTSYGMRITDRSDREVTYELQLLVEEGRGRELTVHAAFAFLLGRARAATGCRVDPVRVTFRQRAPDSRRAFDELFGTAAVDFGAMSDSFTLGVADLALPLRTADPDLSAVLHGYAATLPATPPFPPTWADRLAEALDAALAQGTATLDAIARELHTSPRSLQRRLAESGTSWRRELDRARRRRLDRAGPVPRAAQAEILGYSDAASLRRAIQRWQEPGRS
ncbi:AraC family transcriptional regulator ligand-binding domain-containing protein [Nocardia sp. NPDC006630]|uniref:AraC family transcriptional regulator ligand-binding domain-containing protein n=1 Tax=Nocardia sp. NPDC006630 TaxID=3157181 RepID=UPI0033B86531